MLQDTNHWIRDAVFYHVFPLGLCGAPTENPGEGESVPRIRKLLDWIEPARNLGCNALLLGPVWQSGTHGYDTTDYLTPDRRLGSSSDLKAVLSAWRAAGFRVVFDGVFHHSGRGFPPFADLVRRGPDSVYRDWFAGVDFTKTSPYGDPFGYGGWNGHLSLVKFNLANPEVRRYLFDAVETWIDEYDLDGLRLDAADAVDKDFLKSLAAFCRTKKPDFWFVGEVVHGNYKDWTDVGLDAVTNYEVYKGLWSSHNDANYFEIAWSLNRQFGEEGVYRGLRLYSFAENHDVDRVASTLSDPAHLYPLHLLLFTIPGVPSLYYAEEVGWQGKKDPSSDAPLRPRLSAGDLAGGPHRDLAEVLKRLSRLRGRVAALKGLGYRTAHLASRQFAFWRRDEKGNSALVAVNSEAQTREVVVEVEPDSRWFDLLNEGNFFQSRGRRLEVPLDANWGRVLVQESID